ncbi:hypothetical protein KSP39_PZI009066 [Platanthera zijinensis]|uniref:Uncharacterized protein n=1 Tax=Platanthera zijinensis TaxID=2320716 RepID=A0AAP0BLC2_9ASPA
MAKAAVIDSSTSASALQLGRPHCGLPMKRKTPSELRGEQLKRKNGGTLSVDKLGTRPPLESGKIDASTKLECSDSSNKATDDQGFRTIEKCSQSALRNVVEIHLGNEQPLDSTKVDMEKALKGLVALHKSSIQSSFIEASGKNYDLPSTSTRKVFPEFHMSGQKAPLDFTLKTTLRLISSSSVKW